MSWLDEPVMDNITPFSIILFLLILAGAAIIARLGNMIIRDFLDERVGKRYSKGMGRLFQYTVLVAALLIGFNNILVLDLSALVLSLGVAGIALAFASQQIIQNAISGVLIAVIKPIQLEDWVEVGPIPFTGISRVKDINLMNTVLKEVDGRIITVPNSQDGVAPYTQELIKSGETYTYEFTAPDHPELGMYHAHMHGQVAIGPRRRPGQVGDGPRRSGLVQLDDHPPHAERAQDLHGVPVVGEGTGHAFGRRVLARDGALAQGEPVVGDHAL